MDQGKRRFRALEFFLLFTCTVILALYFGFLDYTKPYHDFIPRILAWINLPVLAGCFFAFLNYFCPERAVKAIRSIITAPGYAKYLFLFVLFWLPRSVFWIMFPPPIESDYAFYTGLGAQYAADGTLGSINYVTKVSPNITMYVAILGTVMRIFGSGADTSQWFCMILNCCNVFLLYAVAKRMMSPARAFVAAVLFAIIPENIFYSVLPGIEAISVFTILLGILLILSTPDKKPVIQILLILTGGVVLALSAFIRSNAWAAVAGAAVWLLLRYRLPLRRMLAFLAALVVGIGGAWLWHQSFQRRLFPDELPAGGIGWPLYEGLDISGGGWTEEKSKRCYEVIENNSAVDADRIFMEEAFARFNSYTFSEKIHMFGRKGGIVWFDSGYSISWIENLSDRITASDIAETGLFICLALWLSCMVSRIWKPLAGAERAACTLCLIFILLTTLWHEFGTSISRYRYMMLPFIMLTIGICLPVKGCTPRLSRVMTRIKGILRLSDRSN